MRYRVRHRTLYGYSESVALGHNQVVGDLRSTARQSCHQCFLEIEPEPQFAQSRRDHFGNRVTYFTTERPHRQLTILLRAEVSVEPLPLLPSLPTLSLSDAQQRQTLEGAPFLYGSPLVPLDCEFAEIGRSIFLPERSFLDCLLDLNRLVHETFAYDPAATDVHTPVAEVLKKKRGVCQDFAHVMIGVLRTFGLPARYVSGYLLTHPPPGKPRLIGADASHAWVSTYLPGLGWIDLDPTNNVVCGQEHIVAAWGRDYNDVAPVRGVVLGGGRQSVAVSVDVQPASG